MRVDLDARVVTRDGDELGTIQKAIFDPRTGQITEFLIGTGGLFGHDVMIATEEVDRASMDGDAIRLTLAREEVENLPIYSSDDYVTPPAGWAPSAPPYGWSYGGYLWPRAFAYPPGYDDYARDERSAVPVPESGFPNHPVVEKGATVVDRYGETLGVVEELILDDRGQLRGFGLRVGSALERFFGGGETIEITGGVLGSVGDNVVNLRVSRDELRERMR